jgi:CRP-like cAMP-binding protein
MALYAIHTGNECRNLLLAALPAIEWQRIRRYLQPVKLQIGQIISEAGSTLLDVYLPTTATISLMYLTVDGGATEIASVGNEGMVGVSAFMGGDTSPARAVVQSPGEAYRLSGEILAKEFRRGGALQSVCLLYIQACLVLVAQTAVCNQRHSVDQRLTRWLLLSFDRIASNDIIVTHEAISKSVGVRREGISEAAGRLQRAGFITAARGRLTILDRDRLEDSCCECYGAIRQEQDRLFQAYKPVAQARAAVQRVGNLLAPKPPFVRRSVLDRGAANGGVRD